MRIAIVAPVWFPVPPKTYGGTERIIHLLTEELVQRGHDVTLFATADSKTNAQLNSVCTSGFYSMMLAGETGSYEEYVDANIKNMISESGNFDIVHLHVDISKIPLTSGLSIPVIYTMHSALSSNEIETISQNTNTHITAVSNSQIVQIPQGLQKNIKVIYNGLDFDASESSMILSDPYLVFIGRMGPQKNPLDAIRIAKAAHVPIILAGEPQNPDERIYFRDTIMPLVDNDTVKYIGAVNHTQKKELLKNAVALLFPITWQEPFGLVLIEAMSYGVPVLAFDRGSVKEIIEYGKTGFYADTADELARFVPQALALNRKYIQESTIQRFNHMHMVDEYVELYASLIKNI